MTKRFNLAFTALLLTSSIFSLAQATPLYITFEGIRSNISENPDYIPPDIGGAGLGDPMQYVIQVDSEPNTHTVNLSGSGYENHYIAYNAQLISGTGLSIGKKPEDNFPLWGEVYSSFSAYIAFNPQGENVLADFQLYAYGSNGHLNLYSYQGGRLPSTVLESHSDFLNWCVGNLNSIDNSLYLQNDSGEYDIHRNIAELNLTTVTADRTTQVPEPETYLLFGLGLVAVNTIRRRILN
jgi:hypothetical protein